MFQLRLLGGFALDGPSGPISGRAAQPRQLAILAPLAVHPKGVTRDKLAGYFWAEKTQETARHLLADVVYILRKGLGEEVILSVGEGLRLNRELVSVDVDAFQRAIEGNEPEQAVQLYGGSFLDGFFLPEATGFERWVESERRRYARLCRETLVELAERAEAAGDPATAVKWWERCAAHDPLDSHIAARLARTCAAAGKPAKALAHVRDHERRLREELDLTLPDELRLLVDELQNGGGGTAGSGEDRAGGQIAQPGSSDAADEGPGGSPAQAHRGGRVAAIAASILALVGIMGYAAIRASTDSESPVAAATRIAVVPPQPAVADTALRRLGRELAVTLSANLDGVGTIRTVPALTVLTQVGDSTYDLDAAAALARRLGATGVVHGNLVRAGTQVQMDVVLFDARTREPLARAAVAGPEADIRALTDSATLAILRGVWANGQAPVPNFEGLGTSSVTALRAYLEGERAFARGALDEAARDFDRAFAADSGFVFAYWRALHAQGCLGASLGQDELAGVMAHSAKFPERDRALLEVYAAESTRERLAALREVTRRHSNYWPGWWEYAYDLRHRFTYLGTSYVDARAALERVVDLNPSFAPAWKELFKVATLQRDTATAARVARRLQNVLGLSENELQLSEILSHLLSSGGDVAPQRAAELADFLVGPPQPVEPRAVATGFLQFGFPRAQNQMADAILRRGPTPEMAAAMWMAKAGAWATRGAWDRALEALDRWVAISSDPQTPLRAYGFAVLGTWMGAVSPDQARQRRAAAVRSAAASDPEGRAELAWLDGVLAWSGGDVESLEDARERARHSGGDHAGQLAASLDALRSAVTGEREKAARALATLELRRADVGANDVLIPHPLMAAVHRLTAARGLLAAGDTAEATRLLNWHETQFWIARVHAELANRIAEPLALLERARIAEARGLDQRAGALYRGFLERYDQPAPSQARQVEEASAALARLSAPGVARRAGAGP